TKLPADENFVKNFKAKGGKFLYCENIQEVMEAFDNILLENDWYETKTLCFDSKLTKQFQGYNLEFIEKGNASFFFTSCEALIGDVGAILLSSIQIKEKKLPDLPDHFVVLATTSQIVESIGEGLRSINVKRAGKIPSNITTIQHFKSTGEKDFMSYGSSTKDVYLLLLEDL